jgi:tetratricopeptide (TPR) repeat protein
MKRLMLRPAILLAVVFTIFASKIQAQDLAAATLLTRSEQYDKANAMFQDLIKKEPANAKNYFYLGENYFAEYFADTISNSITVAAKAAKDVYQKGVDANPNDPLCYIGLAKVAFLLGDDKTAADMRAKAKSFLLPYKNLKKITPPAKDYSYILAKIAESYIKDEKVDTSKALPLVREAIKIDNKNRDVYLIAGDIYILMNDGSKAIFYYNQAEFADSQSPTAAMKIGTIYVKGRQLQAAIPYFEKAIELNATYAPAYRELGQLYSMAGRFDQSKDYFNKYLELSAGNIPALNQYVKSLFYAKDYKGVVEKVEEIFAVDKSRVILNRLAGYSCYEKTPPDYDKAYAYMTTLFKNLAPERLIQKDFLYAARILAKKNAGYPKMTEELNGLKNKLEVEKAKANAGTTADKAKSKANIDDLNGKITKLQADVTKANSELDLSYTAFAKALTYKPDDRNLINEIANSYAINKRYSNAAKMLAKLADPNNPNDEDQMKIGKAYYNGEDFKTADSAFAAIIKRNPSYVPAYVWDARTFSRMDPDTKLGLAKPKFEKVIEVAKTDSVKWESEMSESFSYLGYYHMQNENWNKSKDYYNRMVNLNPNNKENKIKGYNSIGSVEMRSTNSEKTNEGRLPNLARAEDAYSKVLAIDPMNTSAKSQLVWVRDYEAKIKSGINPNEIKGVVKNAAGQPLGYVSLRIKDTAAETLTNAKGEYKFEIPQDSETLLISLKGYKTIEIPVTKEKRVYNATLEQ